MGPPTTCGSRELEKRKREAIDGIVHLSSHARAKVLLNIREGVKDGATVDPDMDEGQKQAVRDSIDWIWKQVILLVEFKATAGVTGGRAAADYEENCTYGRTPSACGLPWIRAKMLYAYMPFDRTINGKVKNPFFVILCTISFIPFGCVRLAFFLLLLLAHLAGRPADTYQMINFVFTMKGNQFKSGGVILSIYRLVVWLCCVTPGDADACDGRMPGHNVPKLLSIVDLVGSLALGWIAFFLIPRSEVHQGAMDEYQQALVPDVDGVDEVMKTAWNDIKPADYEEATPSNADEIHRCFPPICRLPPCVATFRCVGNWLKRWPPGGRRVFGLLMYDLLVFFITLGYLWWLIRFDVAAAQVYAGRSMKDIRYDGPALAAWWKTPEANISLFHARVCYNLLVFPFVIFMAPGLSTIIGLCARTGYNVNGYCVPHTMRPVAPPARTRWACEPKVSNEAQGGIETSLDGANNADQAGGRSGCQPSRACGL